MNSHQPSSVYLSVEQLTALPTTVAEHFPGEGIMLRQLSPLDPRDRADPELRGAVEISALGVSHVDMPTVVLRKDGGLA